MAVIRRIRTVFSGVAGSPWYNNMYFTRVIGTEDAAITAVADFWNDFDPYVAAEVDWEVLPQIDLLDDATGMLTGVDVGTGVSGSGASANPFLPYATQLCINTNTNSFHGGRQLRGKVFVPGLTTNANDEGNPATALLTAANTAIGDLIATTSSTGPLRVYSPTYHLSEVVENGGTMTQFAVLRSRRD